MHAARGPMDPRWVGGNPPRLLGRVWRENGRIFGSFFRVHEAWVSRTLSNPLPPVPSQVYLDPKEQTNMEYKVDTFATVYKRLTGKEVKFEFPVQEAH